MFLPEELIVHISKYLSQDLKLRLVATTPFFNNVSKQLFDTFHINLYNNHPPLAWLYKYIGPTTKFYIIQGQYNVFDVEAYTTSIANQIVYLDNSFNMQMQIPDYVSHLSNLVTFKSMNNHIQVIKDNVDLPNHIQILELNNNRIREFPLLECAPNLQELNLSVNFLTNVDAIIHSIHLHTLYCTANQITRLPQDINTLHKLKYLYLGINQLSELPQSIGDLTQLEYLDISFNRLTSLPDSIGKLTQLHTLNMSNNILVQLPDSICKLTHLEIFILDNNRLASIPDDLHKLEMLLHFSVYGNRLVYLPKQFGLLSRLLHLNINNNPDILFLPESIGELNIDILSITHNRLQILPYSIGSMKNLTCLYIYNTNICFLPSTITNLSHLQVLHLTHNKLMRLPDDIGKLKHLVELKASFNAITSIPESIRECSSLQHVELGYNFITSIPDHLTLTTLSLIKNKITEIPPNLKVQHLYLS